MKYFELIPATNLGSPGLEAEYKQVTLSRAKDVSLSCFGVKGKKIGIGSKVKVKSLYTGEEKGVAEVVEMKNGLPYKVQFSNGEISLIFGLIVEIAGLVAQLWQIVKGIFKKKDK